MTFEEEISPDLFDEDFEPNDSELEDIDYDDHALDDLEDVEVDE